MIKNSEQNNTNETSDDTTFIERLTLASVPTNFSSIDGFSVVNYHAGRAVADVMDRTVCHVRRKKESPNKKVVSILRNSPELYIGIRESMAVVHAKEKHGHTPEDMAIVLNIVLRCIRNKEALPEDVGKIMERNLSTYLNNFWQHRNSIGDYDPNKYVSLDQSFGLKKTRGHDLDPYVISPVAFDLVEELIFAINLNDNHDPVAISLNQAMRNLNDKNADSNVDTMSIDLENDEEWEKTGLDKIAEDKVDKKKTIKGKSKYLEHFNKYKFSALDYLLRRQLINSKTHRIKLTAIQHKVIKKNWGINMPEELRFVDEDYVKQLISFERKDSKPYGAYYP